LYKIKFFSIISFDKFGVALHFDLYVFEKIKKGCSIFKFSVEERANWVELAEETNVKDVNWIKLALETDVENVSWLEPAEETDVEKVNWVEPAVVGFCISGN
jgi:hypothetical protein